MVEVLICVKTLFGLNMFQSSSSVREWSSQDPMRTPMRTPQSTLTTQEMGPVVAYISNGGAPKHCWMCESEGASTTIVIHPILGIVVDQYTAKWLYFST